MLTYCRQVPPFWKVVWNSESYTQNYHRTISSMPTKLEESTEDLPTDAQNSIIHNSLKGDTNEMCVSHTMKNYSTVKQNKVPLQIIEA